MSYTDLTRGYSMNHWRVYLHAVLWWLAVTHTAQSVSSRPSALHSQVGEIEEQLAAARREVTKSEEANQKLQREVKEVCGANLLISPWPNPRAAAVSTPKIRTD